MSDKSTPPKTQSEELARRTKEDENLYKVLLPLEFNPRPYRNSGSGHSSESIDDDGDTPRDVPQKIIPDDRDSGEGDTPDAVIGTA